MSTNEIEPIFPKAWRRWTMSAFGLALIVVEVIQIRTNFRLVETYATSDAEVLWEAVDRLMWFHIGRIVALAFLVLGWRWSVWLVGFTYFGVYLPNPWVYGTVVNSSVAFLFLMLVAALTVFSERQFLFPWRKTGAAA